MIHIAIPHPAATRRLSFFLAMEEHVARSLPQGEYFFLWQVRPSVIFGRNQLIEAEVNVPFCRSRGIEMYRRKSGGGCVYADMSNVMFSYIGSAPTVGASVGRYTAAVLATLRAMGIAAEASGRNDILVGGRKVSGAAFYRLGNRNIVHATMLYDTCMENMVGAITPSDAKLLSKGISSVRQRIALLKDFTPLSLEEFKARTLRSLCQGEQTLTDDDMGRIEELERDYLSPAFIYGHNPRYTVTRRRRIEGVGDVEARIELKNGVIRGLALLGDYFLTGDMDEAIIRPLTGCPLTEEAIVRALPPSTADAIQGLTPQALAQLLTAEA